MTPEEYQDLLLSHGVALEMHEDLGAGVMLGELERADDELVARAVSHGVFRSPGRLALILPPNVEVLKAVRSAALALRGSSLASAGNLVRDIDAALSRAAAVAKGPCSSLRPPGLGRKRSGLAYSDEGVSCGADRSEAGWKERQKVAQRAAWARGDVPNAWPRPYKPQEKPFEHGRTTPVKFNAAEALRRMAAWDEIPRSRRPYERDKNPRVTEIPVGSWGDPDLKWFLEGPQAGKVVVMFSGGKDSLALLLYVIEVCQSLGLDHTANVEAWHQCVDGRPLHAGGESSQSRGSGSDYAMAKWDWPVTEDYCRAVCECLGVPLYFGWREGGLQGTVLRGEAAPTQRAPAMFELPHQDEPGVSGGERGGKNVRMSYPLQGADLKTRWCSSEVKIDVAEAQLAGRRDLRGRRVLYCSGERAEESANRATYAEREFYGDFKGGRIVGLHAAHQRHVEKWRPLLQWCELDVWAIISRWGVRPHPAYEIGFGRLSCMTCIFGNAHQWATVRKLDPKRFAQFSATEEELSARKKRDVAKGVDLADKRLVTIKRDAPLPLFAGDAEPYAGDWSVAKLALSISYDATVRVSPSKWRLPAGAFGEDTGPT